MKSKQAVIDSIFARRRAEIIPGLERIKKALHEFGDPQLTFKTVHLAGTNGKGSTASLISSILCRDGRKTGLFTSPHICHFKERFIVDGIPVSEDEWLHEWEIIEPVADRLGLTFFEISTLLAFNLFKRRGCEWAVIETGMGGSWDATNVVSPEIAAITVIGFDHCEYLGDTLEKIAGEKLGIIKSGVPCVINPSNEQVVFDLASEHSSSLGAPIIPTPELRYCGDCKEGQIYSWEGEEFTLPFRGRFQATNLAVALAVAGYLDVSKEALKEGVAGAFIPGRMQVVEHEGRLIIFDVAHNPQALSVLESSLSDHWGGLAVHTIIGMMQDKDIAESMRIVDHFSDSVCCISPSTPRSSSAENLVKYSQKAVCADNLMEAFKKTPSSGVTVVTGSFFTVGDVFDYLQIEPYALSSGASSN